MEGYNKELALFDKRPANIGDLHESFVDYKSPTQLDTILHFNVPNNGSTYIDLKKSKLIIKCKIVKKDGTSIGEDDVVASCNMPLHAMWKSVELHLQNTLVTESDTTYPYKAYLEYITNSDDQEQETNGRAILYSKDLYNQFHNVDIAAQLSNTGFTYRYLTFYGSRDVELMDTPCIDLFKCDRLLKNGVRMDLKLIPSNQEFVLLSKKDEYKLAITEASFRVCHVHVGSEIITSQDALMENGSLLYYPYTHKTMSTYTIPANLTTFNIDNLWMDKIPYDITCAFVDSRYFTGNVQYNPFAFDHNNLRSMTLIVDGANASAPIQCDFAATNCMDAYMRLADKKHNITFSDFVHQNSIFRMKIRNPNTIGERGYSRIELRFDKPLAQPQVLLIYASFDKTLTVSQARNIDIIEK